MLKDVNLTFIFLRFLFLLQQKYQKYHISLDRRAFKYCLGQRGALESKRLRTTNIGEILTAAI